MCASLVSALSTISLLKGNKSLVKRYGTQKEQNRHKKRGETSTYFLAFLCAFCVSSFEPYVFPRILTL
jgi:hypothetical protein